jgi:hypothetical protein
MSGRGLDERPALALAFAFDLDGFAECGHGKMYTRCRVRSPFVIYRFRKLPRLCCILDIHSRKDEYHLLYLQRIAPRRMQEVMIITAANEAVSAEAGCSERGVWVVETLRDLKGSL